MDDTNRTNMHVLSIADLGNDNAGHFLGTDGMGCGDVIGAGAGMNGDRGEQDSNKDDVCRGVSSGKVTGDVSGNVETGSNENNANGTIVRAPNVYELGGDDGGRSLARTAEARQRCRGQNRGEWRRDRRECAIHTHNN